MLTIVDLGYIQAFGSLCNAVGALTIGQMTDSTGPKTMFLISTAITAVYYVALGFGRSWYAFFFMQVGGYTVSRILKLFL